MSIAELLDLPSLDGFESTSGGFRALHRPDIAPLAYEVCVIASAYDSLDFEKVPAFLDGANLNLFEKLYSSCNGLFVGATKFCVYGFITGDQSIAVPWNIEIPNWYGLADKRNSSLIVGVSTETDATETDAEFYHTIQAEHEIHVVSAEDFGEVVRRYHSVESWLSAEVLRALKDRNRW